MTCNNCKHFDKSGSLCRRRAPQPGDRLQAAWPVVRQNEDWCGEGEERVVIGV